MIKLILDTDPGVDDAMAIAYALCHPGIDLLALTTVFGNVEQAIAHRNAQYLLQRFGARDVAVAAGATAPLVQPRLPPADFVHGADGLGNCFPAEAVPLDGSARHAQLDSLDAADFIIARAKACPGEITLVAVGPLTNVALALRREPALPGLLRELVIMGGAVDEPGNVSPLAEANFFNDPHAADEVFNGDWPASVVGLDVTHQVMLTDTHLGRLRDQAGDTGRLIWETSRFYVDFYMSVGAARHHAERCCAMHDAAAIARVVMPDAFGTVAGAARVVPDGIAVGQFAIDRVGGAFALPHWEDRPTSVQACMQVDAARVRDDFLNTLIEHHDA